MRSDELSRLFLSNALVRRLPRPILDLALRGLADPPPIMPAASTQKIALRALIARRQHEIIDRLTRIHAAPDPDDVQNRFLVLSLVERPGAYVQCAFGARDRWMLCEVASGVFLDVPRTMVLPPETIAAIGRLGFTTDDRTENFRRAFRRATPPDLAAVATLLLTALHVAYDVQAQDELAFTAPYAPMPAGERGGLKRTSASSPGATTFRPEASQTGLSRL